MTTDNRDLNEFLTDRDRILMAAWTLPNSGPLSDAQRSQAMGNFDAYCKRHRITYAEVARQVDKPRATTIRDLVKGTYRENADSHIRTLNMWIEQHARQRAVKIEGTFVQTKTARDILTVARLVRENQTMGLVFGPTGIGKTRCALALHETFIGSVLITVIWGMHHPKGLTAGIAEQIGVRHTSGTQNREYEHLTQLERVIKRLKDSNRLLIVDEAHKLKDPAVELLREIHDATGCPILLLATKELHDRIQRSADPDRGQIYSRFDIIRPLTEGHDVHAGGTNKPLFTIEDIKRLYDQVPIRLSRDAATYLQQVANQLGFGSLRRCRILLTNAARRARKRQGKVGEETVSVTADDLEHAETRLRQGAVEHEIVEHRKRVAAAGG